MASLTCIWPVEASLGEGPLWDALNDCLWFVDILGQSLHCIDPASAVTRSWLCPSRPGFLALDRDGRLLVGLAKSIARFDPQTGAFTPLVATDSNDIFSRNNDGSVGPDGAVWFGTKNEPETDRTGTWFRWDGSGAPAAFDAGYVVTNGPVFSPNGDAFFHADSAKQVIFQRSLAADGSLGPNTPFATFGAGEGYPDGMAMDAEGHLWVAMWGGGAVHRLSPDGDWVTSVACPVSQPTKPAFGGPDMATLFITSARTGLSENDLVSQPQAGGLFSLETSITGLPIPRFQGSGSQRPSSDQ